MICLNCDGADFEQGDFPMAIECWGEVFNLSLNMHRCKKCGEKIMDDEQMYKALIQLAKEQQKK